MQDLAEYLRAEFRIEERSLEVERDAAPRELKDALQTIWLSRYQRRRERYGDYLEASAVDRLVSHDVECYAGVVQLRSKERPSPFGYSAWWLTVDRNAFDLKAKLEGMMKSAAPDSPVMSADFLVNYLAFGPLRQRIAKSQEAQLPLLLAFRSAATLTPELLVEAENLRSQLKDLPERVVRRQVRDHLDRARAKIGPIAALGMDEPDDVLAARQDIG